MRLWKVRDILEKGKGIMDGREWELKITLSLPRLNCNSCCATGIAQALCKVFHAKQWLR